MFTTVGHHDLSKDNSVEVRDHDRFVYVCFEDGDHNRVDLYAKDLEDFEVLFKQALIQIAKIRKESDVA